MIILNDGTKQFFSPHQKKGVVQSIKWDNKGSTDPNTNILEVFKVFIFQNSGPSVEIYSNEDVNILSCYLDNSAKDRTFRKE
jgi:hypothetical protein